MYQRFIFPIFFGLGCLSADLGNLFGDDLAAATSAFIDFDSSVDASSLQSNDAYDPYSLTAASVDDLDVIVMDRLSASNGESDGSAHGASSTLALDPSASPLEFHDPVPRLDGGFECEFPRLAACCLSGDLRRCIWYAKDADFCRDPDNYFCCEQVTSERQGHNCEVVGGWPDYWYEKVLDILRMPLIPEGVPGGVWIPDG